MDHRTDLISTPLTENIVRGALELEQTRRGILPHRLPAWARRYADGQLAMAEAQPSALIDAHGELAGGEAQRPLQRQVQ